MKTVKVMVVDDSAVVRRVIGDILKSDPAIELLGAAADPIFAMRRMEKAWPDVIVLDVEMPRMDGITFLKKLMRERPTPVVICSTLTEKSAQTTMEAMAAGAVDIITKPKMGLKDFLQDSATVLKQAVKNAARAKVSRLHRPGSTTNKPVSVVEVGEKHSADVILGAGRPSAMTQTTEQIVAIGTSTGGTNALEYVLTALPRICPGIVIVQHMPEQFTAAFADRLNSVCKIEVREAKDQDTVMPGVALIAPGGRHMMLKRSGAKYRVEVVEGPLVNRHRPSVDVLFRSVARYAGSNAMGIIMTGMGDDGAKGLLEMHDAGAYTLAQDEESCVVYGMPKEAVKLGATDSIVPLSDVGSAIMQYERVRDCG
ncbi:MAG: chemotaxis response regulator protein-glutamate methylesterase [Gammaproteobacteria bacterium]|nr:chemotaxis response regulator protein-glutamate methylesterase [Gammaproteobacteria bacterium]